MNEKQVNPLFISKALSVCLSPLLIAVFMSNGAYALRFTLPTTTSTFTVYFTLLLSISYSRSKSRISAHFPQLFIRMKSFTFFAMLKIYYM